jgi:hypothetical protein
MAYAMGYILIPNTFNSNVIFKQRACEENPGLLCGFVRVSLDCGYSFPENRGVLRR